MLTEIFMKKHLVLLIVLIINIVSASTNTSDFDFKNFKLMEVSFEETESNNSNTPWKDRKVNFGYKNKPVSEIVEKIMIISGKKIVGLEQLADRKPIVMMTRRKVIKAVTILLKCEGFKMVEKERYFQVVEDKNINRNACLY